MKNNETPSFSKGLSRRDFLQRTTALAVIAGAGLVRPSYSFAESFEASKVEPLAAVFTSPKAQFNALQSKIIQQVQLHLFPDDSHGPSAKELNAYGYLQWALMEPSNLQDGDRVFLIQGTVWIDESANKHFQQPFIEMKWEDQAKLLQRINGSQSGENWLSLLLYYLLETVTLDPLYGGNVDGCGWQWLEYQPGFPRPTPETHYRVFEDASS